MLQQIASVQITVMSVHLFVCESLTLHNKRINLHTCTDALTRE